MSKESHSHVEPLVQQLPSTSRSLDDLKRMLRPTKSVADLGPDVHVSVMMHPDNVDAYDELAARRAPNAHSKYRHKIGLACEVATAARLEAPVNREIYPDFEGDSGFDFLVPRPRGDGFARVEVRGTRQWDDPVREIGLDEINDADRYVLCRTRNPEHHVEIVGSATRLQVQVLGQMYGREGYCLRPDYLSPLGPERISESQVKETIDRLHSSD